MAYTINKTDGTALVTVADGAINTTYSITLIGKNYAGYGEVLNENQIKLSENFANTTANAPASPLTGTDLRHKSRMIFKAPLPFPVTPYEFFVDSTLILS